jgi:hypothetical protein
MQNPYLRSLLNPEKFVAKIPDVNCYDSTTCQVVMDGVMGTATDGSCALAVYPVPIVSQASSGPVISGTATAGGGQGNWTTTSITQNTSAATFLNAFSMYRPVSGVLEVEYIGSTGTDSGQICVYPLFRGETASFNFGTAVTQQLATAGPLRNGIRMLWKPMDVIDLQYEPCQGSNVSTLFANGGVNAPIASGSNSASLGTDQPKVALVAYITGATASTNVARYRWIVNYEAVPERSGLDLFSITPGVTNTGFVDSAMNVIRTVPWADVWQPVAGIVGEAIQQSMGAQMSNLGGLAAGLIGGALQRTRSRASRLPLTYDYAVD